MEFEGDQYRRTYNYGPKGLTGWLIKKGFVPNKRKANKLLIILVFVFFLSTIFVLNIKNITYEEPDNLDEIPLDDPIFLN